MTDVSLIVPDDGPMTGQQLQRLVPQNLKQLGWFANQAAASGLFKTAVRGGGSRVITGAEAFLLMSQGVELGLSPLQSLRELNIIDGRVDVPASVRAARISASPKTTRWEAISNAEGCTIKAKRRDRENACQVTVLVGDLPAVWRTRHADHLEDALYARAVRRISRQYFPDLNLGIESADYERDPERIIDIAAVEKEAPPPDETGTYGPCPSCGSGNVSLQANTKTGGAFLFCTHCNWTGPPPQEVRDAIRGRTEELSEATVEAEQQAHEVERAAKVIEHAPAPLGEQLHDHMADSIVTETAEEPAADETAPGPAASSTIPQDGAAGEADTTGPIPPAAFSTRWHDGAIDAVFAYVAELTDENAKARVRTTFKRYGWNGTAGARTFLRSLDDPTLANLLAEFSLSPPPLSPVQSA